MSIFRKKIDTITVNDVEAFVKEGHVENIRLEYKEDFSSKDANAQIAKEISAFANQQGGVILFGVSEKAKTRQPDRVVGMDKGIEPRKKIQSVCIDRIYPPVFPEIQECELRADPTKVAVVVRVDISDKIHTINDRSGFYIRGDDICNPRPMREEEIELLRNRRQKLIERRELLIQRSNERVFVGATVKSLKIPLLLVALPLFPAAPLAAPENLYEIHKKTTLPAEQSFPFETDSIRTANESIYAFLPHKNKGQSGIEVEKRQYGEVNTFGQVFFCERAMQPPMEKGGISTGWVVRRLYMMMRYLGKFYENIGFWGIVKFIFEIRNCIGVKLHPPEWTTFSYEPLGEVELDRNIKIERDYAVNDIIENREQIVADIMERLLWNCGLNVYLAKDNAIPRWIEKIKKGTYGEKVLI